MAERGASPYSWRDWLSAATPDVIEEPLKRFFVPSELPGKPTPAPAPTTPEVAPPPEALFRPNRNQPPARPPVITNPFSVLGTPSAAAASGFGALIDNPGDLGAAGRAAWQTAKTAPFAESASELPTISSEQRARGIETGGPLASAVTDLLADPTNLLGGDVFTDLGKLAVVFGPKAATKLKAEASLLKNLATRGYPKLGKALVKHGTDVTLPGATRSTVNAFDRLARDIHARTLTEPGTTTDVMSGKPVIAGQDGGYFVGKYSNQSGKTKAIPLSQFTVDDVRAFINENAEDFAKPQGVIKKAGQPDVAKPPLRIGTWREDVNGVPHVFLDVSQEHPTARKATLTGLHQAQPQLERIRPPLLRAGGYPRAQEAIFDAKNIDVLPVGSLEDFLRSPEFQQRLDEMHAAGAPLMEGQPEWWDLRGTPDDPRSRELLNVYGEEHRPIIAGYLAATGNAAPPVHNLRAFSEYMRRHIKGEPIIQPDFRIPDTAVGSLEGHLGAVTPGDFNAPGTRMPMESSREGNLLRVAEGRPQDIREDKLNDMYHALMGEDVGVFDRRWAKISEKPSAGVYVDMTKDKVPGSMTSGTISPYAMIQNRVRDAARKVGQPLKAYSATVWEGIGETIKKTGQLFGEKHPAHSIPDATMGFNKPFTQMVQEKAAHMGLSVEEFKRRLKSGDAELLGLILSTPVGLALYNQWESEGQPAPQAAGFRPSPPPRPPDVY